MAAHATSIDGNRVIGAVTSGEWLRAVRDANIGNFQHDGKDDPKDCPRCNYLVGHCRQTLADRGALVEA